MTSIGYKRRTPTVTIEAISITCPDCHCACEGDTGSQMITQDQIGLQVRCESCGERYNVTKVMFRMPQTDREK